MKTQDPNTAVLDALGIDWKGQDLARVTICLRPNQLPTVHTVRYILDKQLTRITEQRQRFTLTPDDVPAFDLDGECRRAMRRLVDHIQRSASRHQSELQAIAAMRSMGSYQLHNRSAA